MAAATVEKNRTRDCAFGRHRGEHDLAPTLRRARVHLARPGELPLAVLSFCRQGQTIDPAKTA